MRLGLEVCELELSCSSFYKRHFGHALNTMGAMLYRPSQATPDGKRDTQHVARACAPLQAGQRLELRNELALCALMRGCASRTAVTPHRLRAQQTGQRRAR